MSVHPTATDVPRFRTGAWKRPFASTSRFGPLEHRRYPFEHEVDAATVLDRVRSTSWIAVLPAAQRADVVERVRRLLVGMPERFPVPYHTELWWCRAR